MSLLPLLALFCADSKCALVYNVLVGHLPPPWSLQALEVFASCCFFILSTAGRHFTDGFCLSGNSVSGKCGERDDLRRASSDAHEYWNDCSRSVTGVYFGTFRRH